MSKIERPEALAQFAESARRSEREGVAGLTATNATAPIPADPKAKDEAATRILAEGATGLDLNSEETVDQLPDRILESQQKGQGGSPEESSADTPFAAVEAPYDASRDPRTGRPPTPLEAQRLARENELERLSRAQTSEDDDETPDVGGDGDEDISVDSDTMSDETTLEDGEPLDRTPADQAPARMVSPRPNDEEAAAVDDLVGQGVSREWAEELVETHGTNPETLKARCLDGQGNK